MGLVTAQAALIGHFLCMSVVTLHALCRLTMGHMTFFTVQSSMFTRMGFHFLALIRVAGETDSLHLINCGKIHLQRIVGMVARRTIFKCVVQLVFPPMAYGTCRNDTFFRRRMLLVTIGAADFSVGRSPFLYFLYRAFMTTGA